MYRSHCPSYPYEDCGGLHTRRSAREPHTAATCGGTSHLANGADHRPPNWCRPPCRTPCQARRPGACLAAGGSTRQLPGDALTARRLQSGALRCSGGHHVHAGAAKAQRERGTPAAGRGRRTDAWCSSCRQLGSNNVGCACQPTRLASQLVGGLPPSRGRPKVTATHFTCVCPGPRAWEVTKRRQVMGRRPRPHR